MSGADKARGSRAQVSELTEREALERQVFELTECEALQQQVVELTERFDAFVKKA